MSAPSTPAAAAAPTAGSVSRLALATLAAALFTVVVAFPFLAVDDWAVIRGFGLLAVVALPTIALLAHRAGHAAPVPVALAATVPPVVLALTAPDAWRTPAILYPVGASVALLAPAALAARESGPVGAVVVALGPLCSLSLLVHARALTSALPTGALVGGLAVAAAAAVLVGGVGTVVARLAPAAGAADSTPETG
jgi:hypothetical protein